MTRILNIFNLGKHAEKKFDLSEGQTFAFIGKNKSGKSTIINILETIFSANGFMAKPVKDGEKSGKAVYTGEDRNGDPVEIEWEIQEGEKTGKFRIKTLVDGKVKTLTSVTKIREVMGIYVPIDAQDALNKMKYTESRRDFINKYIIGCLTELEQAEINTIDTQISSARSQRTEENLFHTRTEKNNMLKVLQNNLDGAAGLTNDEKELIAKKEVTEKALEQLRKDHKFDSECFMGIDLSPYNIIFDNIDGITKASMKLTDPIQEKIRSYVTDISDYVKEKAEEDQNRETNLRKKVDAQVENIRKGDEMLTRIRILEEKQSMSSSAEKQKKEITKEVFQLETDIQKCRDRKKEILANSSLPAGLEIEEDKLIFNGMPFDTTVVSHTEAQIAMIDLMMKISESELVNIGDWSLYDAESKKEIIAMAEKNERLLVGQMVTDDEEVDMEIIINK